MVDRDGRVVARLHYVVRGRRPFRLLTMPPLTQTLGPALERSEAKASHALGDERELLGGLEAGCARGGVRAAVLAAVMNALPFYWAGYALELQCTYRRESLRSKADPRDGLRGNIRRESRKARALLSAHDERDRGHAVAYVVWNAHAAYYLLGGADPELRTSGASRLLILESIMRARVVTDVFDFEARCSSRSSASSGRSAAARRRTCASAAGPPVHAPRSRFAGWRSVQRHYRNSHFTSLRKHGPEDTAPATRSGWWGLSPGRVVIPGAEFALASGSTRTSWPRAASSACRSSPASRPLRHQESQDVLE